MDSISRTPWWCWFVGTDNNIHEAFGCIQLERIQEVTFGLRDPTKPEEPEE